MKIFLIGLPGSGKTTLGKQLAQHLNSPFIDLDYEIERSEGKSIQKIFSGIGEDYFRKIEHEILKKFCNDSTDFVMATGGGAPCFFNNMKYMNEVGKTVFLDVPAAEITTRLEKTNLVDRPIFSKMSDEQLKDKIEWLRSQRIPFYEQASLRLQGTITLQEIAGAIKS